MGLKVYLRFKRNKKYLKNKCCFLHGWNVQNILKGNIKMIFFSYKIMFTFN